MNRIWTPLGLVGLGVAMALAGWPGSARAAGDAAAGKIVFEQNCASCHGTSGHGDGPAAAAAVAMGTPPRDFTKGEFKFDTDKDGKTGTDADLANVIKGGGAAQGGSPLMAPWGGVLTEQQIQDVIAYIRTFKK
jgi:mono/diheme cytochrome c family protein